MLRVPYLMRWGFDLTQLAVTERAPPQQRHAENTGSIKVRNQDDENKNIKFFG